jgi:hypothetical protein
MVSRPIGRVMQRAALEAGSGWAPPEVDAALASGGAPLADGTRGLMEARFGHDFSRVKVHDGASAALSAAAVRARAYTVGSHVVFGAGQYRPDTPAGQRLLAHELTHVVQQGATGAAGAGPAADPAKAGSLQRTAFEIVPGCPGSMTTLHQGVKDARLGIARIPDPEARECLLAQLDASTIRCGSGEGCGGTTYIGSWIDIFDWGMSCPSLPALLVHEAAHKCKILWSEVFAEACENEAFGGSGATADPAMQGGKCEL